MNKAFWRALWVLAIRSPRDARSRKALLLILAGFGGLAVYTAYWWFVLGPYGVVAFILFSTPLTVIALGAGYLMRRSYRRQDELLSFSLTGRAPASVGVWRPADSVTRFLICRAQILSYLVIRGGNEIRLKGAQSASANGSGVRQGVNARLRDDHLWELLDDHERELMSLADGSWIPEHVGMVLVWGEHLRMIRWVVGLDSDFDLGLPLDGGEHLHVGLQDLSVAGLGSVRIPSDARGVQDGSLAYLTRVVAEMQCRNLVSVPGAASGEMARFRQSLLGDSNDFLWGARTIAELSNEELMVLTRVMSARFGYARYLTELLSRAEPFPYEASLPSPTSAEGVPR